VVPAQEEQGGKIYPHGNKIFAICRNGENGLLHYQRHILPPIGTSCPPLAERREVIFLAAPSARIDVPNESLKSLEKSIGLGD